MRVKTLWEKMLYPVTVTAVMFGCLVLSNPVTRSAEEKRPQQTMEERRDYHLIKVVQRRLIELGYNPGPVDGVNGPRTKKAIKEFQRDNELVVDGVPGAETLKSLGF